LILFAQIITAAQMVYEEKYVVTNDIPPLQAVGWEGIIILYNKMMLDHKRQVLKISWGAHYTCTEVLHR